MAQSVPLVLALLVCAGHGRRLHTSVETLESGSESAQSQTEMENPTDATNPLKSLAMVFDKLKPAAAFSPSGPGLHRPAEKPSSIAPRTALIRMEPVDEFAVSRVIKEVRVFEGDYAADICEAVTEVAKEAIKTKNSFSLAIPGGSVVAALGSLEKDAFDFSKMHIFLVNEKIPSYPCREGALELSKKLGMPDENVHAVGEGTPAEIAEQYTKVLREHASIDNNGPLPAVDMTLLGTGPDGHCGCIFPESPEVRATGSAQVMLAGNDGRADGEFVAASIDMMCASKVVLVSAAGAGRAPMVAKALGGEFSMVDCPAALVEAQEGTFWFTDKESIAEYEEIAEDEEDYEAAQEDEEEYR